MTLAVAVVMRAALLGTAAGPPDFDRHRLCRRIGFGFGGNCFGGNRFGGNRFGRRGFAGGLGRRFSGGSIGGDRFN